MGNQETKVHYKMYKAGKLWLYSSVALVSLAGMGMGTQVASADEKGSEPSSAVVSDDDADKVTDENVVSLDADVSTEKTDATEANQAEAAKASVAAPVKEAADSSKQEVAPKAETKASVTETSKQEVAPKAETKAPATETSKQEVAPKAEAEVPATETSKQEVAPKAEAEVPATETSKQEVAPKAEAEAPATETSEQEVAPKAEAETPATETSKQEVAPKAATKAPTTVERAQASQKEAAKKQAPKADDIVTLESLTSDLKTSFEYQALTKTQQAAALSYAERQLRAAQKAGQATYANKAFAPFALIQGSVLEDVKVTNDSGTKRGGKADDGTALKADNGVSDVVIKLNGTKPADVSLIGSGKKVAGIQIPAELIGRVTPNGTAKINTSISIRLDEVPLLRAALEGLQAGVNTFDSVVATLLNEAAKAIPVEIVTKDADGNVVLGADGKPANGLQTTVDAINNLLADAITFDQADLEANMKLSDDGSKMITAELNDDFADVIAKNLTDALDHIYDLIGGLTVQPIGGKYDSNPIIAAQQIAAVATANTALTAAKLPLRAAVETLKGVVTAGGAILDQFGSAAVLGDTEVDMPISIDTTGMDQSVIDANNGVVRINGMVSTDDLLALNLFNDKTDSTNIYFETSFDQLTSPKVNATTDEDGKSTITVEGEPNAEITVKDADGNVIATGTTDADGKLTLDLPEDSAGKKITVDQTVDGETSDPTEITVPTADLSKAKEDAKNKIDEMPNLTDAEKDDFKKQVDDATSKNDVNKVVDDAQAKNDAKANDPLADAKDEAKDKIDNMPNLTDAEKDAAKDAVDDATSQDEIDKAVDDAQEKNDAKANDPLADAKDEAKDNVDKNMPDLSDQDKKDIEDKINDAKTPEEIDQIIKDAEDLNDAKKDAKDDLKDLNDLSDQDKKDIEDKINDAKTPEEVDQIIKDAEDLNDAKKDAKDDLKDLNDLSDQDKKDIEDKINDAKTPEEVEQILNDAKNLNDSKNGGEAVDNLQDAKNSAKDAINKLPNLTDAEKRDFIKRIDGANSLDAIENIAIEAQNLNDSRNQAGQTDLQDAKDAAKNQINGLQNLTDAQKQDFLSRIDVATSVSEINAILAEAKALDAQNLARTKDAAYKVIDGMANLTDAQKAELKGQIEGMTSVKAINDALEAAKKSVLPNTGAEDNGMLSVIGASMLGMLGLAGLGRRKKN